jgi:DNA polymerase-3 subunit epsilon
MPMLSTKVICTCKLARRLMPHLKSKSLGPLAAAMGIGNHQRHRAAGDAYTTAQILIRFLNRMETEFEVGDVDGLMRFQ